MTKDFYTCFLSYVSPKELKKLYSNLCKQKISVRGFTPNKAPPAIILAPQIAKNERAFFDVLEKTYTPNFESNDDATNSFSPDMAVICLTYFVRSGLTDEAFLMSLLSKEEAVQEEFQLPPETGRGKKKAEEFRKKYLSTRRELQQLKDDYIKLQAETASLKVELREKSNELDSVRGEFLHFEKESSLTVDQLKKYICELEERVIEYQSASPIQTASILLIMDTDKADGLGIDILTYDNISKLFEISGKYDEILMVINDLPFAINRKIRKINAIQEKLVTFSTKQEMLEYAKQRREN